MVSLMDLSPFTHSTSTDVSISVQMVVGFVGKLFSATGNIEM
jgi:hypothetical protein